MYEIKRKSVTMRGKTLSLIFDSYMKLIFSVMKLINVYLRRSRRLRYRFSDKRVLNTGTRDLVDNKASTTINIFSAIIFK